MADFIRINPADNVAVAIHDVEAGAGFGIDGVQVTALERIPAGHKMALCDIICSTIFSFECSFS